MKRTALLMLLAVGCAHAPARELEVATTETRAAPFTVIRGAAVDQMLGVLRPSGSILDQKLVGSPAYLGTIDYTGTSKTNHQATTPFNNTSTALCGKLLLLQPSTAVYILPVNANDGTVTAANGVKLQVDERVIIFFLENSVCWLAALRVSASGDLKAWELK